MFNQETTLKLKEMLIESIGEKVYLEKIRKIADIINDFEYKEVMLPVERITDFISEVLTTHANRYYLSVFYYEEATVAKFHRHGVGQYKFRHIPTTERIKVLLEIKEMRSSGKSWTEISNEVGIKNCKSMVNNLRHGFLFATQLERDLIGDIYQVKPKIKERKNITHLLNKAYNMRRNGITWKAIHTELGFKVRDAMNNYMKGLVKPKNQVEKEAFQKLLNTVKH